MNQVRHLQSKARALFTLEAKLSHEEKATQQWQLLTNVCGVSLIVGKGGVNTAFYVIHDMPRQVCYPTELLDVLGSLASAPYAFYALMSEPKTISRLFLSESDALKHAPIKNSFIVGISPSGTRKRLFAYSQSLVGPTWKPYTS